MNAHTSVRNLVCATVLLAVTVLYNVTAIAEGENKQAKPLPPPAKVAKPADPAQLNPEQRRAFYSITKDMYESMRGVKELHEEIRKLIESNTYDEKKVRALIQKHHKEMEEKLVKSANDMNAFYKTLSPEQKKQLDALREKMKEKRRDEMKDRDGKKHSEEAEKK